MAESLIARVRQVVRSASLPASVLLAVAWTLPLASGSAEGGTGGATVQPASPGTPQTRLGERQVASVEKHIATLHSELRITPAQEPLWKPLAGAMRDSVLQLDRLYAQREKQQGSMSAVDDLKSYALVQQTRARNVQALIGPFQSLYDSFSASQKRRADETFREFTESAVRSAR